MSRAALALLSLVLAAPLFAEPGLFGASESIPRNLVAGGGQPTTGPGLSLNSAVAETGVADFSGSGFQASAGLMNISAQPGSVTSITAVTKSTGTLQLAWSAPGLDGFVGAVANGYYRIDTSSDPAHVFDPTVFIAEFSTSVVPGAAQSYALTGLQPNTTYYSRVYLADVRKVVAETSAPSNESTFANLPSFPVLSAANSTSVTFTWSNPAFGAEGYGLNGSTEALLGGTVVSSMTSNGLSTTLTISGLMPNTTYFFKLGSLNWQSQTNYTTIFATCTLPGGGPPPILGLAALANSAGHSVTLTWTNPVFPNPAGVLVLVSTNPISVTPTNGASYKAGATLADGSVVTDTAALVSYSDGGLPLDTTEYFSLFSDDAGHSYSAAVSTSVALDLPPLAVSGLAVSLSGSTVTLRWNLVASKTDGSSFRVPTQPSAWELAKYAIYQATGIVNSNWSLIGTAPMWASSCTVVLSTSSGLDYYYEIVSQDGFPGQTTDAAMAIDLAGDIFVVSQDQVTRLMIPASMTGVLGSSGNPYGTPLILRAQERPQDIADNVVQSVSFGADQSPSSLPAPNLRLPNSAAQVTLHYSVAAGLIAAAAQPAASKPASAPSTPINAANAAQELGMFWNNNQNYVKLFGQVDASAQTVSVNSAMTGTYQLQTFLRTTAFSFDISQMSNKFITPNGDGLNDTVVWNFDNPLLSAYSGKIFDIHSALVASMEPGPISNSLMWDGRSNGRVVPRGVYVYQIQAEGKTFNGTVVVIR